MRLIITFLMAWCLSLGAYAATAPDAKQLTQELEQAKAAKPAQPETVEALQSALNALEERKGSLERAQQYQQVIDNFPKLSATLRAQLSNLRDEPRNVPTGLTTDALNRRSSRSAANCWKRVVRPSRSRIAPGNRRLVKPASSTANRCPPPAK